MDEVCVWVVAVCEVAKTLIPAKPIKRNPKAILETNIPNLKSNAFGYIGDLY